MSGNASKLVQRVPPFIHYVFNVRYKTEQQGTFSYGTAREPMAVIEKISSKSYQLHQLLNIETSRQQHFEATRKSLPQKPPGNWI